MRTAIIDMSIHGINVYEPTPEGRIHARIDVPAAEGMGKILDSLKAAGYRALILDRLCETGFRVASQSHLPGGGGEQWHLTAWNRPEWYYTNSCCPKWNVVLSAFRDRGY